jgi:hypothetical protein
VSKEKPFENRLPAFIKKNAIDIMLFGYVCGMRRGLPAVNINKSIELYLDDFGLQEDYPFESAQRTYTRIAEDFLWIDDPQLKGFIFNIPKGSEKVRNILLKKIKRRLFHYPVSKNYLEYGNNYRRYKDG